MAIARAPSGIWGSPDSLQVRSAFHPVAETQSGLRGWRLIALRHEFELARPRSLCAHWGSGTPISVWVGCVRVGGLEHGALGDNSGCGPLGCKPFTGGHDGATDHSTNQPATPVVRKHIA